MREQDQEEYADSHHGLIYIYIYPIYLPLVITSFPIPRDLLRFFFYHNKIKYTIFLYSIFLLLYVVTNIIFFL